MNRTCGACYKDFQNRLPDLDQLEQIAAGYDSRDVFLAELALDPPNSVDRGANGPDPDEDYTILSTIHSAKGQEWQIVRILNVVDGGIPSSKAGPEDIEEELRLLHVAMTRAKDQLDLLVPQQYHVNRGADWVSTLREASRFVPESIHRAFECRTWHERRKGWAKGKPLRSSTNVSAAVSQMWEEVCPSRKVRREKHRTTGRECFIRRASRPEISDLKKLERRRFTSRKQVRILSVFGRSLPALYRTEARQRDPKFGSAHRRFVQPRQPATLIQSA